MKRLAFLGAMNRDLVADIAGDVVLKKLKIDAPPLIETPITDALAEKGARLLGDIGAADYLGGSAFNAARVAALLNSASEALSLSFFGTAGTVEDGAPHLAALADWHVSSEAVRQSPLPPATCLAMVESAGRTLLTATGANAGIADYLRDQSGDIARRLAASDVVHITSFLDPASPGLVAALLDNVRQLNPDIVVSLDPGAAWIIPGGEGFAKLLAQTDILHLNNEEFAHFGSDDEAIAALGARLHSANWLIVARNHLGVALHWGRADQSLETNALPETPLPASVLDSTGAGDTFCGAFLWHFCTNPAHPLDAARHGFTLARAKIAINGPLTKDVLASLR